MGLGDKTSRPCRQAAVGTTRWDIVPSPTSPTRAVCAVRSDRQIFAQPTDLVASDESQRDCPRGGNERSQQSHNRNRVNWAIRLCLRCSLRSTRTLFQDAMSFFSSETAGLTASSVRSAAVSGCYRMLQRLRSGGAPAAEQSFVDAQFAGDLRRWCSRNRSPDGGLFVAMKKYPLVASSRSPLVAN